MRCKRLRLFIQYLRDISKGYNGRFSLTKASAQQVSNWCIIVNYSMKILWRKELSEQINRNRIANMKICCQLIDNTIVRKGEIFSLQFIVGEPCRERGFFPAPTIINGKLQMDYGGGICQISTILFNAALRCNLNILEKHNHSSDIWGDERLVELGLDATYAFGRLDLKFENNLETDIVVRLYIDENDRLLVCSILAPIRLDLDVKIETEILREILPCRMKLMEQQKFRKGWVVLTRRTSLKNGIKSISYEKIEKYKPVVLS